MNEEAKRLIKLAKEHISAAEEAGKKGEDMDAHIYLGQAEYWLSLARRIVRDSTKRNPAKRLMR